MEHTPKEEEIRDWREELYQAFHNMPSGIDRRTEKFHEIAKMIDNSILKIRREAIAEEREALKKWAVEFGATGAMIDQRDRKWIDLEDFIYHLTQE